MTNRARCALNKEIFDLLNEESISATTSLLRVFENAIQIYWGSYTLTYIIY